jgi:hypothetical protein
VGGTLTGTHTGAGVNASTQTATGVAMTDDACKHAMRGAEDRMVWKGRTPAGALYLAGTSDHLIPAALTVMIECSLCVSCQRCFADAG